MLSETLQTQTNTIYVNCLMPAWFPCGRPGHRLACDAFDFMQGGVNKAAPCNLANKNEVGLQLQCIAFCCTALWPCVPCAVGKALCSQNCTMRRRMHKQHPHARHSHSRCGRQAHLCDTQVPKVPPSRWRFPSNNTSACQQCRNVEPSESDQALMISEVKQLPATCTAHSLADPLLLEMPFSWFSKFPVAYLPYLPSPRLKYTHPTSDTRSNNLSTAVHMWHVRARGAGVRAGGRV